MEELGGLWSSSRWLCGERIRTAFNHLADSYSALLRSSTQTLLLQEVGGSILTPILQMKHPPRVAEQVSTKTGPGQQPGQRTKDCRGKGTSWNGVTWGRTGKQILEGPGTERGWNQTEEPGPGCKGITT